FRSCGPLFLWPVSHSPTLCHLARTPHSRSADLDVSVDLYPHPGGTQCVGNALGERHQHAREQTGLSEKTWAQNIDLWSGAPCRFLLILPSASFIQGTDGSASRSAVLLCVRSF